MKHHLCLARLTVAVLAGAFLPMAVFAAEWFVSPTGSDSAAGTETAPFQKIQYAVGRASTNDTITLLPGDYGAEQGTTNTTVTASGTSHTSANRVVIDKPLTLRSKNGRASRDTTRIVGAWDTDEYPDLPWGFGPNAVRCVWIAKEATGTRLEGITFADGSVPIWGTQGNDIGAGGGVVVYDSSTTAEIVDCAVVNCQGYSGGGICSTYANAARLKVVRTLFKRCRGANFGQALRGGGAYNCVFDDNGYTCFKDGTQKISANCARAGAFSYGYAAINCTFVNNKTYGVGGDSAFSGGVYNCLFQKNGGSSNYAINTDKVTGSKANNVTGNVNLYTRFEVISPSDGDYRLTSNADAKDAGDATKVSSIPEEFRGTDYYGNPLPSSGAVHAGAVQAALTGAASGVYIEKWIGDGAGTWLLGGEEVGLVNCTWKGAEGWPFAFQMKFVPVAPGRALVNYSMGGVPYWPLPDDSIWVTAKRNQVQGISPVTTANIFYSDPVNGSDETGDGSEANPYKTLNKAVKKTTVSFVVRALPGDYNEGGENIGDGITTRVVVPKNLEGSLRVVAVGGPENTFITGALDASTSNGTGNGAARCIAVVSTNAFRAAFQGFTLRNGRTGPNGTVRSMGAAFYNSNMNDANYASFNTGYLLDCVVTNCSGNRAGCVAGGNALRCRFEDCSSFNGGGQCLLRYCNIVSSLFNGCGGASQLFGNTARGYNCTIWGSVGDAPQSVYNSGSGTKGYLYNSVSGRPSGSDISDNIADDQLVYTLYCRMATNPNTFTTAVKEEPLKLLGGGNCRLAPDSAGVWLASSDNLQSCMDIDGNPFLFDTETGRYQAGCYAMRVGGSFYVDAVNGSDANDGLSDGTAFKTLAAAMDAAGYMDTVIALPGTYDEGTMVPTLAQSCYTVAPTLPARVVVKGGVTLESQGGAKATIIKGQASPTTSRQDGCGDGAVRGVFLCAGATLRGFTVTGGRTLYLTSASIDAMGGGICGAYSSSDGDATQWRGRVENCIVSDNVARTGGGAQYGTYRNCRFEGNTVYNNLGYALCRGLAEGCVFKGNGPSNGTGHSVCYDSKVVNCTLFGGQAGATTSNRGLVFNEGTANRLPVLNSILLGNYATGNSTNNFILSGASNTSTLSTKYESGLIFGDASVVDADGMPAAGTAVVNAGDASFCSAEFLAGRDIAGTRRVLNSTIDIGAFEYDWGVPWAKALGGKKLAIDDMPGDAALVGDRLTFADGTISMTWEKGRINAPYIYNVRVTGNGTLTVTVNGETVGTYTAADGAKELRFTSELASNAIQFAYAPGDGDVGGAELYGFNHSGGLVISFR